MPAMRSHDDYVLNGQWNYCHVCQTHWSDADGGCQCEPDEEEEEEDDDERELREWLEERRKSVR